EKCLGPSTDWNIDVLCERLPADERGPHVGDVARARKDDEGWDLVICITDLPRHDGRRAVIADVDVGGGMALASLPSLGAVRLRERVHRAIMQIVAELMEAEKAGPSIPHADRTDPHEQGIDVRFLASWPRGYLRLAAGMVRANRPWFLARRLYRVLVAAIGTGAYLVMSQSLWMLSGNLQTPRLIIATVLSVGAMVTWIIVDHDLWEKRDGPFDPERARLYNTVTAITFTLGISVLYLGLFLALLAGTLFLIDGDLLAQVTKQSADVTDYLRIAWLGASVATVAGALGSSLENDKEVREAAYGYRQRERMDGARDNGDARRHEPRDD
ncbi:MAG: hypothetical protein QOH26_901, partial [Actinomycetota bacterium]|nr:hypothetical protein [Actinomycetota bacterium]